MRIRGITSGLLLAWLVGIGVGISPAVAAAPTQTGADLAATLVTTTATKVHPGESFSYQVTVVNHGPDAARNVRATDLLPAGLRFQASADGCTNDGQAVTCANTPTLADCASKSWTFSVLLDPLYDGDGSDLTDTATAASDTPDPVPGNNTSPPAGVPGGATLPLLNWGDAPDSYHTTRAEDGPYHEIIPQLGLGTGPEPADIDGRPSTDTSTEPDPGALAQIPTLADDTHSYDLTVTVRNHTGRPATLAGWIDFARLGTFDAAQDRAVTQVPDGATAVTLHWGDLSGLKAGRSFVRLRLFGTRPPMVVPRAAGERSAGAPGEDGAVGKAGEAVAVGKAGAAGSIGAANAAAAMTPQERARQLALTPLAASTPVAIAPEGFGGVGAVEDHVIAIVHHGPGTHLPGARSVITHSGTGKHGLLAFTGTQFVGLGLAATIALAVGVLAVAAGRRRMVRAGTRTTLMVFIAGGMGVAAALIAPEAQPARATPSFVIMVPSAAAGPLTLTATPSQAAYAVGDPVKLSLSLANASGKDCLVAAQTDGTVSVTSVVRDGVLVTPELGPYPTVDLLGREIASAVKPLDSGAASTFELSSLPTDAPGTGTSAPPQALTSVSWSADERNVLAAWPLDKPGTYSVSFAYAMPPVPGSPANICQGTATATATITISASGPPPQCFAPIPLLLFAVRRRRPARATVAAFMTATLLVLGSGAAFATIEPEGGWGSDTGQEVAACMDIYQRDNHKADPQLIINYLQGTPHVIHIREVPPPIGSGVDVYFPPAAANGMGTGSQVSWDRLTKAPFQDGTIPDGCAELYHELYHSYEAAKGIMDAGPCGHGFTIASMEADATLAENTYRGSQNLPLRKNYGTQFPLPPSASTCLKDNPGDRQPPSSDPLAEGYCADVACGSSNGDPHLTTFDGLHYDFQAAGEFDAVTSAATGADSMRVQIRQVPFPGFDDVSVNQAVALDVGGDRFTVTNAAAGVVARVNGTVLPPGIGSGATTTQLAHGGVVTELGTSFGPGYTVTYPDGSKFWVTPLGSWGLKLDGAPAPDRAGKVRGLLGDFNGDPSDDLVTRQGAPIAQPPAFDQLYKVFGASWRITQAESLFDYDPGQDTNTFTLPDFPSRPVGLGDLSDPASAKEVCREAGVTQDPYLSDCTLDVGLTGRVEFAEGAQDEQSLDTPKPGQTPPTRDGDTVSGTLAPGGQQSWELNLGGATVFRLLDVKTDPSAGFSIDPAQSTDAPGFSLTDAYSFHVQGGTPYRLTLTSDQGGPFSFRLVTLKDRRIPAAFGTPIAGHLDVPGRVDLYEATPPSDGHLSLAGGHPCEVTVAVAADGPSPVGYSPAEACTTADLGFVSKGQPLVVAVYSDEATSGDYGFTIQLGP